MSDDSQVDVSAIRNDEEFKDYISKKYGKSVEDMDDDALKTLYSSFDRNAFQEEQKSETLSIDEGKIDEANEEKDLHPWMKPIDEYLKDNAGEGQGAVAENGKDYIFTSADGQSKVQYEGPVEGGENNSTHNPKKVTVNSADYHFIKDVLAERQKNGGFNKISLSQIKTPEMAAMMVMAASELGMEVLDNNEKFKISELSAKLEANGDSSNGYDTKKILGEFKKFEKSEELKEKRLEAKKNLELAYGTIAEDAAKVTKPDGSDEFSHYLNYTKALESGDKEKIKEAYSNLISTAEGKAFVKAKDKYSRAFKEETKHFVEEGKPFDTRTPEERKNVVVSKLGGIKNEAQNNGNNQKAQVVDIMAKHVMNKYNTGR